MSDHWTSEAPVARRRLLGAVIALLTAFGLLSAVAVARNANPVGASVLGQSSQHVALVPGPAGPNGGTFPTTGFPNGYAPSFTNVSPDDIAAAPTDPLTAYDTVVLVQIRDIGTYLSTAQFKTRLDSFVSRGGKLIIWDSEMQGTDYSKFVYPFTTNNPGAMGAYGTLQIVEENSLSSASPASPAYVDAAVVSTDTDAVGDANVFATYTGDWYLDMSATNTNGFTGPVQVYARDGAGLIIYCGLDMDVLTSSTGFDPSSSAGDDHLARVWYLELLQPFNPDNLPSGTKVFGVALTPKSQTLQVGAQATVSASLSANGVPQANADVTFTVTAGPNLGQTAAVKTDSHGIGLFSYRGGGKAGTDTLEAKATLTPSGQGAVTVTDTATVTWTSSVPAPQQGYRLVGSDGGIFDFGAALYLGNTVPKTVSGDLIAVNATPSGKGYWMVGKDGSVFTFGDAQNLGNAKGRTTSPVTNLAHTPDGRGYWLAGSDGNVYAFGSAANYGNARGVSKYGIEAIESTLTGKGYWLVASDGGVFSFGDARFYGSGPGIHLRLNAPVIDMAITPTGHGYWLVARDGGVFSFGDARYFGNTVNLKLNGPVVGIDSSNSGKGYWLVGSDGGVFSFGDAPFLGSMASTHLRGPMIDIDNMASTN